MRFSLLLVVALIGVLAFSCKDKCGSTTCQNGGTCSNNLCVCPPGYSGTSCDNGWSNASIGTYNCRRFSCNPAVITKDTLWQSAVTKDATNGGYTIDISNFDDSRTTVIATIDSAQNIIVSPAAGTYGVNATGTYTNGKITLHFTTSSAGGPGYTCAMEMTKL